MSKISLPADDLWGSFVTHSFLDKRTPKDGCGEASLKWANRKKWFQQNVQIALSQTLILAN